MGISSKAMLVHLNISGWSGRRHDDDASNEVANNHSTTAARAGRYHKCLIDTKAESFRAVKQAEDRIRKYHYEHTLPWAKNGAQMLPQKQFFDYAAKMQELRTAWEAALKVFFEDYPRLKANAKVELNGLYKETDYPNEASLKRKFGFSIDYFPVPDAQDWRVDLGEEEEAAIRANITAQVEAATHEAMRELAERLLEPVRHMAEKLSVPGAIFRDSLIENVKEMVDLVPRLNVADDSGLEALRKEVRDKLTLTPANVLRTDEAARKAKAAQARAIEKKMAAFLGAMQ